MIGSGRLGWTFFRSEEKDSVPGAVQPIHYAPSVPNMRGIRQKTTDWNLEHVVDLCIYIYIYVISLKLFWVYIWILPHIPLKGQPFSRGSTNTVLLREAPWSYDGSCKSGDESITGWWFGTFLFFPIVGMMIQSDFHIFQRGRSTTNQIRFLKQNRLAKSWGPWGHRCWLRNSWPPDMCWVINFDMFAHAEMMSEAI
jgi:hypothetical protein